MTRRHLKEEGLFQRNTDTWRVEEMLTVALYKVTKPRHSLGQSAALWMHASSLEIIMWQVY